MRSSYSSDVVVAASRRAARFSAAGVGALMLCALPSAPAVADRGYDQAQVVAVEPLFETVAYTVPRESCRLEEVAYRETYVDHPAQAHRSYTGPLLGALVGGVLGNAMWDGERNRRAGTVVGAVVGAGVGAEVQRRSRPAPDPWAGPVRYRTERVCDTWEERREEQQIVGYHVTYRYAGATYTTRMDHDPGDSLRVRVDVTPVG